MRRLLLMTCVVVAWGGSVLAGDDGHHDIRSGRDGRGSWGVHRGGPYYTPHYEPHGREVRSLPYNHCRLFLGGLEFFYAEGMYYRHSAGRYVVVPAPVGAVVTTIPRGCSPVIVEGVPYYNVNGATYMQSTYGYQVVPPPNVVIVNNAAPPPPTVVSAPAAAVNLTAGIVAADREDTFTVNIPNSQGTYTPVTLKRSGNGFVGPQDEFYPDFPRVEQLKLMYGK